MKTQLPNSGKIIIIDDNYKEALPLIKVLSKLNYPFLYLDGNYQNMPENLSNIRIIFLDIELPETKGAPSKNKASVLFGKLNHLIQRPSNPYFIFFWTRHDNDDDKCIEYTIENLKKANIPPIGYTGLEKNKILGIDDEQKRIEVLNEKIEFSFGKMKVFSFMNYWENMLNSSANSFFNEMLSIVDSNTSDGLVENAKEYFNEQWSQDTINLFNFLAIHFWDKKEKNIKTIDGIKGTMQTLNSSFLSSLNKTINDMEITESIFDGKVGSDVSVQLAAKINTKLFFNTVQKQKNALGSIYFPENKDKNNELRKALTKKLFKASKIPADIELCYVTITPSCDLVRMKDKALMKQFDDPKTLKACASGTENKTKVFLHRIVYGCIYSCEMDFEEIQKQIKDNSIACYQIGPFYYDGTCKMILLHFGTVSNEWIAENVTSDLSINTELAFDLQSNISNHVNRLGNNQIQKSI